MWWLLSACTAGVPELEAVVFPSERIPAAASVVWDGPAGHALLEARSGTLGWRTVAEREVEEGRSTLPLALLPAGRTWHWRLRVDDGQGDPLEADGTFAIPEPPPEVGDPRLDRARADSETEGGYLVGYHYATAPHPEEAAAYVLDGDGHVVWWLPPLDDGSRVIRVKPSADGHSVLVLLDHEDPSRRRVLRVPLDGEAVTETSVPDATHDFVEGDGDGTLTSLVYHRSSDPADLMPGIRGPVVADVVRTVPEGATDTSDAVDVFDFLEDAPYRPWWPCHHADYDQFVEDASEWTHVSSLMRDPAEGGWLLLVRHLDALVHVTDEGAFDWQVGGRDATIVPGPGAAFEHGHASDAWADEDGTLHVLVFDNGDHTPKPIVSRVVELSIDPERGTATEVWEHAEPHGAFVSFLGDARRLPHGNTLIVWSSQGDAEEVTPEGDVVWRLELDGVMGRSYWVPKGALRP